MNRAKQIEAQISELSTEELAQLRSWFAEFDAEAWDREIEGDIAAGKLDRPAGQALREHAAGKSTKL